MSKEKVAAVQAHAETRKGLTKVQVSLGQTESAKKKLQQEIDRMNLRWVRHGCSRTHKPALTLTHTLCRAEASETTFLAMTVERVAAVQHRDETLKELSKMQDTLDQTESVKMGLQDEIARVNLR